MHQSSYLIQLFLRGAIQTHCATLKGTVMQIEKALINDCLCVSKVSVFAVQLFIIF